VDSRQNKLNVKSLGWAGHLAGMGYTRNAFNMLVENVLQGRERDGV
jgi:hypothetical protein